MDNDVVAGLVRELRVFAEGNHDSSGYLLTKGQAKMLVDELDSLWTLYVVAREKSRRSTEDDSRKHG